MSIKYYCDGCERELVPTAGNVVLRCSGRITVQVTVAVDGKWGSGQVCPDCVILAVNSGRPWAEPKPEVPKETFVMGPDSIRAVSVPWNSINLLTASEISPTHEPS